MITEGKEDGKLTEGTFADDIAEGADILDKDDLDVPEEVAEAEEIASDCGIEATPQASLDDLVDREATEQLNRAHGVVDEVIGETIVSAKNMIVREVMRRLTEGTSTDEPKSARKGTPGRPTKEPPKVQAPKTTKKKKKASKKKAKPRTVKKSKVKKKKVKKVVKKAAKKPAKKAKARRR